MAVANLEQSQAPVRLMERKHITMIEDDVVDRVAVTCGMAASGLYMMLERRVNRDGEWTMTLAQLSHAFGQTERHVRDAAKSLEDHGFIERHPVCGPSGMTIGVRFVLPLHPHTYRAEPTPEPGAEPTPEPSRAQVKEISNYSNHQVVTSSGDTPPTPVDPPKENPKPIKRKHRMPEDFGLTSERLAYALEHGMTEPEAADLLEDMRLWSHGKGGMYEEWDLAWKSWVRKHARERPRPRATGSGLAIVGGEVRTGGAAKGGMTPAEIREYGRRRAAQEAGGQ